MGGLTGGGPGSPQRRSSEGKGASGRKGIPIVLLIIRYFLYVLLALVLLFAGIDAVWTGLGARGDFLWANYGERHLEEVGRTISSSATVDDAMIPAAYWYRTYDHRGRPLGGDMGPGMAADADLLAADHPERGASTLVEEQGRETGQPLGTRVGKEATYAIYATADGSRCVLAYQIMPQWVSKQARDRYPNPQDFLLAAFAAALPITLLAVGLRAAHVISSKLKVFNQVAADIGRQDLEVGLPRTNILEINRVLDSFDRMRVTLRRSLEATWTA